MAHNIHQKKQNGCVIIPAYHEEKQIRAVVQNVQRYIEHVVVVDDGSLDKTSSAAAAGGAHVIRHEHNMGKGAALNTGLAYAASRSFDFVITLDADGQHAPEDIPAFVTAYLKKEVTVLVGNRMSNPKGMPLIRKLTNIFMSWYLSRIMGQQVLDTQCGYRLYAASVFPYLKTESAAFAAESETLLRLAHHKIKIGNVPISVIYGDEKSNIRPFRDTIRFFLMLRRLQKQIQEKAGKEG
jgi:glycosyltransferase involved in cell wall biosynthesis